MLQPNNIYLGDCLELMKQIPDKSIDCVITDPPYNINIAEWDKIDNYIEWCKLWILECQRVLKDNGSFYFWHNDINQIVDILSMIKKDTKLLLNGQIVWHKENFRALSWKNPSEDSVLRSWFNVCEYCYFFTFQDETGLTQIEKEYIAPRNPFAKELRKARIKKGVSINEVAEYGKFYGNVNHGGAVTNWERGYNVPLKEQWLILCENLPIVRKEYEDLRKEYEDLRYTHVPKKNHCNVWQSKERNTGELHPTQKPVSLIKRIIETSSNENDLILDPFLGSGTTAIACYDLKRRYIGIEKEPKYFEIAKKRIDQFEAQGRLF